jgi:DNA replication protein DnaC
MVWDLRGPYQTRSTILTSAGTNRSAIPPSDGILDRLVHNAHRIEMRGESMRKEPNPPDEKKE